MRTLQLVDFEVFVKALERGEKQGCHVTGFRTDGAHDAFYVENPGSKLLRPGEHHTVRYDPETHRLSCDCVASYAFGHEWCMHRSVVVAFMVGHW